MHEALGSIPKIPKTLARSPDLLLNHHGVSTLPHVSALELASHRLDSLELCSKLKLPPL